MKFSQQVDFEVRRGKDDGSFGGLGVGGCYFFF